jgi:hypothetical protein
MTPISACPSNTIGAGNACRLSWELVGQAFDRNRFVLRMLCTCRLNRSLSSKHRGQRGSVDAVSSRKPFLLPGTRLVIIVVLVAIGIGVGTDAAPTTLANSVPPSALGAFVGYRAFGTSHSISAEWRVPRILGSSEAHASTWIGLQNESGAFIQVGTTEDSFVGDREGIPHGVSYAGFWSGDKVEFRPQPTLPQPVRAGDLMSASISETKSGWRVQLVDTRNEMHFVRTMRLGTTDLTEAEWFQEDPTDEVTNSPLPYPHLSQIRWTNLELNGDAPNFSLDNQEWMSVPGMDYAPTTLKGDSYRVIPVHLDSLQVRWAIAKVPYSPVAKTFDDEEATWREHPPSSRLAKAELRPFVAALHAYDQTLAHRSWPPVPRSDIHELIVAYSQDGAALAALANAEPKPSTSIIARLDETRINLRVATQRVLNQMGLPSATCIAQASSRVSPSQRPSLPSVPRAAPANRVPA